MIQHGKRNNYGRNIRALEAYSFQCRLQVVQPRGSIGIDRLVCLIEDGRTYALMENELRLFVHDFYITIYNLEGALLLSE